MFDEKFYRLRIVALLIALFGVMTLSRADSIEEFNQIMERYSALDLTSVSCIMTAEGLLANDLKNDRHHTAPCVRAINRENVRDFMVIILENNGEPKKLLQVNTRTLEQKVVWVRGEMI